MTHSQMPGTEHGSEPMEPFAFSIALDGEWDLSRGNELSRHIQSTGGHPHVIFDLSDVTYIDSKCIGMLMRMHAQRMTKGYPPARFVVTNANVLRTLAIVSAEAPWSIFETLDEALRDWQRFGNISAADVT